MYVDWHQPLPVANVKAGKNLWHISKFLFRVCLGSVEGEGQRWVELARKGASNNRYNETLLLDDDDEFVLRYDTDRRPAPAG